MNETIVCFSHLRWNFVYQRPQHLMSRFAAHGKVIYIEEPMFDTGWVGMHAYRPCPDRNIVVLVPHLMGGRSAAQHDKEMSRMINEYLDATGLNDYVCWYYSPMALKFSSSLTPVATVYDCMDELTAFKFAPEGLAMLEQRLLTIADVVFTGGVSLFKAKRHLHKNIHAFPSSIDKVHFGKARQNFESPADQADIPHPRFGFYGVLDERLDIELLRAVATARPDWHFILIGPVVKISPDSLPKSDNVHYLGQKSYDDLPWYLSGWDVAFMPFALNESTRFISPTKTPEYLAGGKPVISSAITDVVDEYGSKGLVEIAEDPAAFIDKAEKILNGQDREHWLASVDYHLADNSWDLTWSRMATLVQEAAIQRRRFNQNYFETCSITS